MEEGASDRKYDKNENNDEEKEAELSDDTSPIEEEKGETDRKDEKNKNIMRKKTQNAQMKPPLLIWRKV